MSKYLLTVTTDPDAEPVLFLKESLAAAEEHKARILEKIKPCDVQIRIYALHEIPANTDYQDKVSG